MRLPWVAIAISSIGCGSGAPSKTQTPGSALDVIPDDVTIETRGPKVGERTRITQSIYVRLDVHVRSGGNPPAPVTVETTEASSREEEMLEVLGEGFRLMRVTYKSKAKTMKTNGTPSSEPSPVAGHSYLVHAKKGAIEVTTPDGDPVDEEEASIVSAEYKMVPSPKAGGGNGSGPTAPDALRVGDRSDLWESKFLRVMSTGDDSMSIENLDLQLAGVRATTPKQAVFKVGLTMNIKVDKNIGAIFSCPLSGTWGVRADTGANSELTLSGPLKITPSDPTNPTMEGTGKMRIQFQWQRL